MNKPLTYKKHSKIIAKLALSKNLIDKKFYDELYFEAFKSYGKPKRKSKSGYGFDRYYIELHYCTCDYWGEWDEHSLIDYIRDLFFYGSNAFDTVTGQPVKPVKYFSSTKEIIKHLRNMKSKDGEK